MTNVNEAAKDLWAQIFSRAAELPDAAMNDPNYQSDEERERILTEAFLKAGWCTDEINRLITLSREREDEPNANSPGVAPGLEAHLGRLSNRISEELSYTGAGAHQRLEVAIDPKVGIEASLTNVIMTDEAILTVSSFLFRWCGLIARAYTRTLLQDIGYWSRPAVSVREDMLFLIKRPALALYWGRIFMSFAATGTHVAVPYLPSARHELHLMEQVAWSMEYFTVAHEFGHHMLLHRSVEDDPKEQEYEADRFAIRICERLTMEPFGNIENPYLRTGAGGTLMLKALAILRSVQRNGAREEISLTHPSTEERIRKIMNRHAMQPDQFRIDLDFNETALRVMTAVAEFLDELRIAGGDEVIRKMKDQSDVVG